MTASRDATLSSWPQDDVDHSLAALTDDERASIVAALSHEKDELRRRLAEVRR